MSPWRALIGAAALTVAFGCSGVQVRHELDASSAAGQISQSLAARFEIAPPPVRCPRGIKVVPGHRFDCTTALEGQPLIIHVTLDDSTGRFTPKPGAAVVMVSKVVDAIQTDVRRQNGVDATVDCGPRRLLVAAPGETFRCTTRTGTVAGMATVTIQNVDGDARYELAGGLPATAACRRCA